MTITWSPCSQSVTNDGAAPVSVRPIAMVNRTDRTASVSTWQVHSGPIGAFDGAVNFATGYKDVAAANAVAPAGMPNWIGIYRYLLAVRADPRCRLESGGASSGKFPCARWRAVPRRPGLPGRGRRAASDGQPEFARVCRRQGKRAARNTTKSRALPISRCRSTGAGSAGSKNRFSGCSTACSRAVKNFGVALILLTLIVRGAMFPVAQRQFASMAAMRAIQPKMKAIQERYKDDKPKAQQEVMALYKAEGGQPAGPAACRCSCRFRCSFALYKVLVLTIEMRHQPFVGWIHDLSAPDPSHVLNLFGLLPFTPSGYFGNRHPGDRAWARDDVAAVQAAAGRAMDPSQQQVDVDHAVDDDVRDVDVRIGPADLLDHVEPADDRATALSVQPPPAIEGPGVEGPDPTSTAWSNAMKRRPDGMRKPDLTPKACAWAALEERASALFSGRVEFLKSAPALKFLPDPVEPEIAFAGRSNVGKSSLLNAVTGRKSIARASVTPGRTQGTELVRSGRSHGHAAGRHARLWLCQRRRSRSPRRGASWCAISCAGAWC